MFGQLRHPRPLPRRRQAGAALLAVLLTTSIVGSALFAGGQQVVEWPDERDEPLVVQVILDEAPLPAPPGPGSSATLEARPQVEPPQVEPDRVEPDQVEAPPDESADALAQLEPVSLSATPISNGLLDQGQGGGGACDSPPCGPCQGPDCGTSSAPGDGGPVRVQSLAPRRMVEPTYPQAAHELGLPSTRCVARFTVDKKGRPVDIQLQSCPTAFRAATLEAAWDWRFWPARVDGRAVDSTFLVAFTFTPR
jgi:outer membrane biosynthesis protein TonB